MYRAKIVPSVENPNWVILLTPYNAEFVQDLKFYIPSSYRVWNPDDKHWVISKRYIRDLENLCKTHFGGLDQSNMNEERTRQNTTGSGQQKKEKPITGITPAIEAVFKLDSSKSKKLYSALAKVFHPDVGGSDEVMTAINNVFDRYK